MQYKDLLEYEGCENGLLVRLGDRFIFMDDESLLSEDQDSVILDTHKSFDVYMTPAEGKIQCQAVRMSDGPLSSARILIPKDKIIEAHSLKSGSFVFQAIVQVRSGIVLPQNEIKKKVLKLV